MASSTPIPTLPGLPPSLVDGLPLQWVDVPVGERNWRILSVVNQDALLDIADRLAHVPYGFLLWESAVALARWLVQRPELVIGKRLLELGAGLGLPGLVARSLGAEVWQTDHEPHVLTLAAVNAEENGVTGIRQFVADWRSWVHPERYDLILGADILYERIMHAHLKPIFRQNLAPGGQLLLADPSRPQALNFVAALENEGWRFDMHMQSVNLSPPSQPPKPVEVALWDGRQMRSP